MDKNLIALACLLQAGYTHRELREYVFSGSYPDMSALSLWESTKLGKYEESLEQKRVEKITEKIANIEYEDIEKILQEKHIDIITIEDSRYPQGLKMIGHAPAFLYVRGNLRNDTSHILSVVGSRKNTAYAEKVIKKILPDIIHTGMGIISGGATGVDRLAHEICLEYGGYTIAVFGTGIDRCYPSENKKLFEKIIDSGGALISHFPLGTGPELYNFPIRNEIVAAISDGVLIPEAALSSGTLITAQLALEHGRDVFAVPGDIDRVTSEGTNMLISSGQAKIVRSAGDILEEYFDLASVGTGMTPIVKTPPELASEVEKKIYNAISLGTDTADTLAKELDMEITEVLTTVALLEIGGHVKMDEMGRYSSQ